jgi:hypothetical protein
LVRAANVRVGSKPERLFGVARPVLPGADMVRDSVRWEGPRLKLRSAAGMGRIAPCAHGQRVSAGALLSAFRGVDHGDTRSKVPKINRGHFIFFGKLEPLGNIPITPGSVSPGYLVSLILMFHPGDASAHDHRLQSWRTRSEYSRAEKLKAAAKRSSPSRKRA